MPANPAKAIIFYNHTRLVPTDDIPVIHTLCQRGCGGQLMLETSDATHNDVSTQLVQVIQLLGLSGCDSMEEMRAQWTARFGKMKLGVVSSSPEIITLANDLDFSIHDSMLGALENVDCLFVDSCSWSKVNSFLEKHIDSTPDLLKCVVMPSIPSFLQSDPLWADLVPHQSCMTKNGEPVKVSKSVSLVCAYLHEGSTRRDAISKFSADDIKKHGCNGAILAWHYLAEIGHKLGFVPKYGA